MPAFLKASKVFDGTDWLTDRAIVVEKGTITALIPFHEIPEGSPVQDFEDNVVVPGFIDLQVYGAANRLFSVFPESSTLQLMNEVFSSQGTILFQPTVATNTIPLFKKCIDAVKQYQKNGGKGVIGLHLEGPWLNPEKRGAHVQEWIHAPDKAEVEELLEYGEGVISMITLAPEICPDELIQIIADRGIIVSAGHSNASYEEAYQAFEKKHITTVTHLFNAMSPLQHRAPGLAGATLQHDMIRGSIIPDGHHVDYAAITIAKKLMKDRLFAITDAVTETKEGPYRHEEADGRFECNGVLSGSAISMHQAFLNLVQKVGIESGEAIRMCSLYPAQVMRLDNRYGKIAPGYRAQLLMLNQDHQFISSINEPAEL